MYLLVHCFNGILFQGLGKSSGMLDVSYVIYCYLVPWIIYDAIKSRVGCRVYV